MMQNATRSSGSSSGTGSLLQRKCACGTHTGGGGSCAQCSRGEAVGGLSEQSRRPLDPLDRGRKV